MLFASWLYKDDELRDGKKLFPFVFSFSKMMLSFSKRMVSFRKVHWVFFLSLELRSSFEKKNSMDFPSGHHPFASGQHHFASGENNCKKFFAIPQYPHPYIIFWQIKTPDFIFQLLSIISHPFSFILQQTPIQNYKFWSNPNWQCISEEAGCACEINEIQTLVHETLLVTFIHPSNILIQCSMSGLLQGA